MPAPAITDERFWAIIDEARNGSSAPAASAALKQALSSLNDSQGLCLWVEERPFKKAGGF